MTCTVVSAERKSSYSANGGNCTAVSTFRKSSFSINDAGAGSECAEVGAWPADGGVIVVGVRDSKLGDDSPVLEFGGHGWGRFLAGIRQGGLRAS